MNIEGIPPSISPEFLQALATGGLTLLLVVALLELQGRLWRAHIWSRCGSQIEQMASRLGGKPAGRWTGWAVIAGGTRVDWTGSLRGLRTQIRVAGRKHVSEGLLDAETVASRIAELGSPEAEAR